MPLCCHQVAIMLPLRNAPRSSSYYSKPFYGMEKSYSHDSVVSKGLSFEKFMAAIYEAMGYEVTITKASGDQGADLILTKDGQKKVVQTKRYENDVSNKAVQEVISAKEYYDADYGIVVSTSGFQPSAIELAERAHIELIDSAKLKTMIEVYDITPQKTSKPISDLTFDDIRPKHPDYKKIIRDGTQDVIEYLSNHTMTEEETKEFVFEKLKPALLTPTDHQECSDKILEMCKHQNATFGGAENRGRERELQAFMETIRLLEGDDKSSVPEQELIDELIKSEKFKDEDRIRRFIRKMINEAAIYESTPGHYNTV